MIVYVIILMDCVIKVSNLLISVCDFINIIFKDMNSVNLCLGLFLE